MTFSEVLNIYFPVSDATTEKLHEVATVLSIKKKDILVEQGKRSDCIYFLTNGLFRAFSNRDGQEDTLMFAVDGDPFASIHSMVADEPATYSWQALDNSEVYAIPFTEFKRLLHEHNDLLWWLAKVFADELYNLERRQNWIGDNDASQRYDSLLKVRSKIINRIPVKYIAQYLKVKPETLSRIRARYARKPD